MPRFFLRLLVLLGLVMAQLGPLQARESTLPLVAVDALPVEAQRTIALIARGGPFPYSRDGLTFQNRERLLPPRTRGYYREYTVPTPGSRDRGARRIVAGVPGELYYTADHYRSFRRVVLPAAPAASNPLPQTPR